MDRKYGHRGYRDAEKSDKKERSHDRKPAQGGPRPDQFGRRTPRMVGTVTRARCSNCGAVLAAGFDSNGACPKCAFELHCCKQCSHFEPSTRFQCLKPIPVRIAYKDKANECTLFSPRVTVARDAPAGMQPSFRDRASVPLEPPRSPSDARNAFDRLFKKDT